MLHATTGHVAECPDLGPECAGPVPPTPYNHHVALFLQDVSLDAAYGVAPWLAVEARFAVRIADITPTYSELDGTPKSVPNDIHHHDLTYVGPSDPWVVGRVAASLGDVVTVARLGFTIPIGRTEPNPYELGARGEWHEHTQFGTGTVMPVVGVGLSWAPAPVELSLTGLGLFGIDENRHGYRAPSRIFGSLRATVPLLEGRLRPYAAADVAHETEELWDGRVGGEGSNVRTDILLGAGIAWTFAEPWTAEIGFRARAAQLTDAASFDYPGLLQIALSTRFDLAPSMDAATRGGVEPAPPPPMPRP